MTTPERTRRPHRGFGKIRPLPSGRYQASYMGPDLNRPPAFDGRQEPKGGSSTDAARIAAAGDEWTPPKSKPRVLVNGG